MAMRPLLLRADVGAHGVQLSRQVNPQLLLGAILLPMAMRPLLLRADVGAHGVQLTRQVISPVPNSRSAG